MKDFQTNESEVLLEEVQVNGQDIYLNLSASNVMGIVKYAKEADLEDVDVLVELARMLFTPKSFELVSVLSLEQFYIVLDEAQKVLDEQEKTVTERFSRAE